MVALVGVEGGVVVVETAAEQDTLNDRVRIVAVPLGERSPDLVVVGRRLGCRGARCRGGVCAASGRGCASIEDRVRGVVACEQRMKLEFLRMSKLFRGVNSRYTDVKQMTKRASRLARLLEFFRNRLTFFT